MGIEPGLTTTVAVIPPSCDTCIYFRETNGICAFNPPTVIRSPTGSQTVWPAVKASDWCGQFKKA